MTIVILKRSLGEAGAAIDKSHGVPSRLYDVLNAMAKQGAQTTFTEATPTAAVKATYLVPGDGVIGTLAMVLATAGTADSTDVVVNKNGTPLATGASVAGAAANDGVATIVDLSGDEEAAVVAGDVLTIEVTAIASAGSPAGLSITLSVQGVTIEV